MNNKNMEQIYKYSFFYNGARYIVESYLKMEEKIEVFYQQSLICKTSNRFVFAFKVAFHHSSIGRLLAFIEKLPMGILKGSLVVQYMIGRWKTASKRIAVCLQQSRCKGYADNLIECFTSVPLKMGGFVFLIFMIVNVILILIFYQDVTLFGWIMRGILLFLGFAGLFCNVSWDELKNGSMVLQKLTFSD